MSDLSPPSSADPARLTLLLERAVKGDAAATNEILPLVYEELRRMARAQMALERPGQTLQPTALVHEAYLRLLGGDDSALTWSSRGHFFGAAAQAMRRILVDRARGRGRLKRGGDRARFELADDGVAVEPADDSIVAIDGLLDRLAAQDPGKAQVVMLRYFTGLTLEQTGAALEISVAEVRTRWVYARAWMHRELEKQSREG